MSPVERLPFHHGNRQTNLKPDAARININSYLSETTSTETTGSSTLARTFDRGRDRLKLTLPAPESPTSTIFSRFSAESVSTSDMKVHDELTAAL